MQSFYAAIGYAFAAFAVYQMAFGTYTPAERTLLVVWFALLSVLVLIPALSLARSQRQLAAVEARIRELREKQRALKTQKPRR